jgi:hypothetical protein
MPLHSGFRRPARTIPALLKAANDPSPLARSIAIDTLGQLRAVETVDTMIERLSDFGAYGAPDVVPRRTVPDPARRRGARIARAPGRTVGELQPLVALACMNDRLAGFARWRALRETPS